MRKVENEFNIHKEGRSGGNGRRYVLHAVKKMIASPATQEGLRLGELVGYYGHGRRQMAGKLRLAETEVIQVGGKSIVIENVPSNRTEAIEVDDSGNVRHTEEVMDTPPGLIVQSLLDSGAGGWSWACHGPTNSQGDFPRQFFGFDYVNQPNYVPLSRQQAMFESVGVTSQEDLIRHNLMAYGIDEESCGAILESWGGLAGANAEVKAAEYDTMMLEGMLFEAKEKSSLLAQDLEAAIADKNATLKRRKEMMLEALEHLPIMLTREQREAMARMDNKHDAEVFQAMLESVGRMQLDTLPLNRSTGNPLTVPRPSPVAGKREYPLGAVMFQPLFKGFRR